MTDADDQLSGLGHVHADPGERAALAGALLRRAASCSDERRRRALMREVADLHLDLAVALATAFARDGGHGEAEEAGAVAHARAAYRRWVLTLSPADDVQLLELLAPVVRTAVRDYLRDVRNVDHVPGAS